MENIDSRDVKINQNILVLKEYLKNLYSLIITGIQENSNVVNKRTRARLNVVNYLVYQLSADYKNQKEGKRTTQVDLTDYCDIIMENLSYCSTYAIANELKTADIVKLTETEFLFNHFAKEMRSVLEKLQSELQEECENCNNYDNNDNDMVLETETNNDCI